MTWSCVFRPSIQILDQNITVQEFTADAEQSVAVVKGVARNAGGWPVEICTISVSFFDYGGNKLGEYTDSKQRLEAGETWDFRVEMRGKDSWKVAYYTLVATCR